MALHDLRMTRCPCDPACRCPPLPHSRREGLSIVDEIIRSHFGELQVESVVGKVSVLTDILPNKLPEQADQTYIDDIDLPDLKEEV